jgi:hypothetical protein
MVVWDTGIQEQIVPVYTGADTSRDTGIHEQIVLGDTGIQEQ